MSWKPLKDGREIDPDFYVKEGKDAVYEESALVRRVYGWKGRMFPRLSLAVYNGWKRRGRVTDDEPVFSVACSYKSGQGQWWSDIDIPTTLLEELIEMLLEAKTQLSKSGDG